MKIFPLWLRWLIGLFLSYIALAAIVSTGSRARPNARRSSCQSNLRQIALACKQYLRDSDNYFPPISRSIRIEQKGWNEEKKGWAELLYPYSKNWNIYQCPEGQNPLARDCSDYFYNAQLAQKRQVAKRELIILFGDGYDNGSTNAHLSEPFLASIKEESAPAWRHLDGANYAFADGHIKWLKPNMPSSERLGGSDLFFTFNPN